MKVFLNHEGKIKDIHTSEDTSLQMYDLDETVESFPFTGWPDGRILCYRINVAPIMENVEVALTEEEIAEKQAEIDAMELADGEDKPAVPTTKIVQKETGKYMVTMMTPYVDTRIIEKIEDMYREDEKTKETQIQTEQTITDMDLQNIEAQQLITDMDLRIMELEGK